MSKNNNEFNAVSFLVRLAFAVVLVLVTYNSSGYSYFHWLKADLESSSVGPMHFLAGMVLIIGWTIYVRATSHSLGVIGMLLAAGFIGGLVWALVDFGILAAKSATAISWIALVSLAVLLAIGMSWSHIRRRLTGQVDTDELE